MTDLKLKSPASPTALVGKEEIQGSLQASTELASKPGCSESPVPILHKLHIETTKRTAKPTGKQTGNLQSTITSSHTTVTTQQLATAVSEGRTFVPGFINGNREAANWVSQSVFALDIDNKSDGPHLSPVDFLERLTDHGLSCAFIYTTFSHTEERPKYRPVFQLSSPVTTAKEFEQILSALIALFPEADRAPSSRANLFYGGRSLVHEDYGAVLDIERLRSLQAKHAAPTVDISKPTRKDTLSVLCEKVSAAAKGTRNSTLTSAAFIAGLKLSSAEFESTEEVTAALVKAGCGPGDDEAKVIDTVERQMSEGFKNALEKQPATAGGKNAAIQSALFEVFDSLGLKFDDRRGEFLCSDVVVEEPELWQMFYESTEGARFDISLNSFNQFVYLLSKRYSVDPILEYFKALPAHSGPSIVDDILENVFDISDSAATAFLKRWLISIVARAYEPGCKADLVLLLVGHQGIRKSSFFSAITPLSGYFLDTSNEGKDELIALHSSCVCEYGELESTIGRRGNSRLKAMLASSVDLFRPVYGRKAKRHPRRFVFCASTNLDGVLNDPTGGRRYLPIKLPGKLKGDVDWLKRNLDAIWSEIKHLYQSGERWWLTETEESEQVDRVEAVTEESAIRPQVEHALTCWKDSSLNTIAFTTAHFIQAVFDMESKDLISNTRKTNEVKQVLADCGYPVSQKSINGKRSMVVTVSDKPKTVSQPGDIDSLSSVVKRSFDTEPEF